MMYMKKNKSFWPYLVRKNTYIREYDLFKSRLAHHRRSKLSIACSDFLRLCMLHCSWKKTRMISRIAEY